MFFWFIVILVSRSIVSTVSSSGNSLTLRPQSVVVLTDKYIAPETPTVIDTQNAGTQIGSTSISLLSIFLLLRYFLWIHLS